MSGVITNEINHHTRYRLGRRHPRLPGRGAPGPGVPFTNHSGTICKNYNAADANFIDYLIGTRSNKNVATYVICPLTRDTQNGNGAFVFVDITHDSNATTTCTAYSFDFQGNRLASGSATFTGFGFRELVLSLNGAGKSNAFSDYNVLCSIPGQGQGVILGVDLSEL